MKEQEYSLFIYRKDARGNWYKQEISLAKVIAKAKQHARIARITS